MVKSIKKSLSNQFSEEKSYNFRWRSDWWPVVPPIWSKRHDTTDDQVSKSLYRATVAGQQKKTRSSLSIDRKALISNNGNYQSANSKFNLLSKKNLFVALSVAVDVVDSFERLSTFDLIQLSTASWNYACQLTANRETFYDTSNYILKLIIFPSRWRPKRGSLSNGQFSITHFCTLHEPIDWLISNGMLSEWVSETVGEKR